MFPWLAKRLLGCICLDPGLNNTLRMLFTINIGMQEERVETGFLLSPHCCCGEEGSLAEVEHLLLGAGALSLLLFTVYCDPRLPHSSDVLRSGENTRKISSQTLIEKTKQTSVALTVMAFVTKMDCLFFKISRVTCLQEMPVFGQEDAPGL